MGRGLSNLQKTILWRAWSNRQAEGVSDVVPDVWRAEPFMDYWGWRSVYVYYRDRVDSYRRNPGGQIFDRRLIHNDEYRAAQVSVTRAFERLAARGLLNLGYSLTSHMGGFLTEQGIAAAKGIDIATTLLANRVPSCHSLNR